MRVALTMDGVVTNVAEYADDARLPEGAIVLFETMNAEAGWPVVDGVIVPPTQAPAPRSFTPLDLVGPGGLLTDSEKAAISMARRTDIEVDLWAMAMLAAEVISVDDPRTQGGFAFAVAKGLLSQERADQILYPKEN